MEPNNLENQIQEKLSSRTIQPSSQAWDRLDAMLAVAEEKKAKRSPFWSFRAVGIAAAFLIFPVIVVVIFLENSNPEVSNEIPIQNNQNTVVNSETPTKEEQIQNSKSIQIAEKQSPSKTHIAQRTTHNSKPAEVSIITRELSSNRRSNQNQSNPIVEVIAKKTELLQPFINKEVVVNQKNEIVEIEIPTKKEFPTTKIKVNAASLLSQVDGELEQKFRETKLEKIARNINTVKVALANRNKQ